MLDYLIELGFIQNSTNYILNIHDLSISIFEYSLQKYPYNLVIYKNKQFKASLYLNEYITPQLVKDIIHLAIKLYT